MNNEQTNKTDTEGDKPLNIVEEARKVHGDIKAENDRREDILKKEQQLKANSILGGTSGGHVEAVAPVEETPQEYADRVMKNDRK